MEHRRNDSFPQYNILRLRLEHRNPMIGDIFHWERRDSDRSSCENTNHPEYFFLRRFSTQNFTIQILDLVKLLLLPQISAYPAKMNRKVLCGRYHDSEEKKNKHQALTRRHFQRHNCKFLADYRLDLSAKLFPILSTKYQIREKFFKRLETKPSLIFLFR